MDLAVTIGLVVNGLRERDAGRLPFRDIFTGAAAVVAGSRGSGQVETGLAAIASDKAIILKSARLTTAALGQSLHGAGRPSHRTQLLPGPGETARNQFMLPPVVEHVSLTGSTALGRHIRAVCRRARTQLELVADRPTRVWWDTNLDLAVAMVIQVGCRKAGHVGTTSIQRHLVHSDIANEMAERLADSAAWVRYGKPRTGDACFCLLFTELSARRAERLVDDAIIKGTRLRGGGCACSNSAVSAVSAVPVVHGRNKEGLGLGPCHDSGGSHRGTGHRYSAVNLTQSRTIILWLRASGVLKDEATVREGISRAVFLPNA